MTTSNSVTRNQCTATASQTSFTYQFKIFTDSEISVDIDGVTKVLTTDYTVTGAGNAGGGTIVLVTPATGGEVVTLTPNPAFTQDLDYVENDDFPSASHEEGLDRSVIRDLKQQDDINRAFKFAVSENLSTLSVTVPTPSGGKALRWNDAGTALQNSTADIDDLADAETNAEASAAAAAASESAAASSESAAAASAVLAQAAVGGVRVSENDTTADDLETKLLVGSGLAASTQNDGANETRTLNLDINGLTSATAADGDEIPIADISDSNNIKKITVGDLSGVKVSSNDTTSSDLETKLLAGDGLTATTQNDGGNETRTFAMNGGWVLLSSQEASNSSEIDFTSDIDSTYNLYILTFSNVDPATDGASFRIRTGAGSFDTGTNNYNFANFGYDNVGARNNNNSGATYIETVIDGVGDFNGEELSGHLYMHDPSNAAKYTTIEGRVYFQDSSGNVNFNVFGGKRLAAQADDRIRFYFNTGNINTGTFKLYGIK